MAQKAAIHIKEVIRICASASNFFVFIMLQYVDKQHQISHGDSVHENYLPTLIDSMVLGWGHMLRSSQYVPKSLLYFYKNKASLQRVFETTFVTFICINPTLPVVNCDAMQFTNLRILVLSGSFLPNVNMKTCGIVYHCHHKT